jgi:IMP dehydrogenase/GMP reductase
MKRPITMTALGLLLALGVASCAQPGEVAGTTTGTQVSVAEPMSQVAQRVDNFRLVTADGHARELGRYKDASAIVLVMHAAGTADTAKAAVELNKLQAEWAPKGVEFMLVNSTKDTREAMLADAEKNHITAPILQDDLQLVGGQIGASRVGQAFVIEPKTMKIVYTGPLAADPIAAVVAGKPPLSTCRARRLPSPAVRPLRKPSTPRSRTRRPSRR